jgi:hypothetical protein
MKSAMTLTTAMLALAISANSASAQRSSGGGTIGCDPSLPSFQVTATNCRLFHKEVLYGPAANPYAEGWVPERVIVRKKVVKLKKVRSKTTVSGSTGY